MKVLKWLLKELGFEKNTDYQRRYYVEANIRTVSYMSCVVLALELWMILRFPLTRTGLSFLDFFDGESNYFLLAGAALILLVFSLRYIHSIHTKWFGMVTGILVSLLDLAMITRYMYLGMTTSDIPGTIAFLRGYLTLFVMSVSYIEYESKFHSRGIKSFRYGQFIIALMAFIMFDFGVKTSMYDIGYERQILCFVTMIIFATCVLIWKPAVTILISGLAFLYFFIMWMPHLQELDALHENKVLEGDRVNFFIFWIVLLMVSVSIYKQRRIEAEKDEWLLETNNALIHASIEDKLTGISNIDHFSESAETILKDPDTDPASKVFVFLNIGNFKTFNEQYGYRAGNEFLKKTAALICKVFLGYPVARQSDDHFVILADLAHFQDQLDIIRKAIAAENSEVYLILKAGAYVPKGAEEDPHMALDRARYACSLTREDKPYLMYDEELDRSFHRRQYVVNNIDKAIKQGYIHAFYQPEVKAGDHSLYGAEALARWQDPQYGMLSPADFIPILEESRQIHKLDMFMFETVCRDIRSVKDAGLHSFPVSINLSRLDFEMMDVADTMKKITEKYDISPSMIHIEITESALSENISSLNAALEAFRREGFSLWIDDFGSGYSSLSSLKDFSFDVLKIDMGFLTDFSMSEKSRVILSAVIELARIMGMQALPEGVETEEEAEFLEKHGCSILQGYLFGKPMPLEELRDAMESGKFGTCTQR